jgi:hypothetical protein
LKFIGPAWISYIARITRTPRWLVRVRVRVRVRVSVRVRVRVGVGVRLGVRVRVRVRSHTSPASPAHHAPVLELAKVARVCGARVSAATECVCVRRGEAP